LFHSGDEPRIVPGFAAHLVIFDEAFPGRYQARRVVLELEGFLELRKPCHGFVWLQSKPVLRERTGGNDPELIEVLRHDAQFFMSRSNRGHGPYGHVVVRVPVVKAPREDIRIEKNSHSPRPEYALCRLSSIV